jgi:hypothetical protein
MKHAAEIYYLRQRGDETKPWRLARPGFARGVVGGAKPRGGIDLRRSRQLRLGVEILAPASRTAVNSPAGHSSFHLSPEAALRGGLCVQFVSGDEQAGRNQKSDRERDNKFSHRVPLKS